MINLDFELENYIRELQTINLDFQTSEVYQETTKD